MHPALPDFSQRPDDVPAVAQVRLVTECRGRRWAVSPRDRIVYVLDDPNPAVVGVRVADALAVLRAQARPALRVLAGGAR